MPEANQARFNWARRIALRSSKKTPIAGPERAGVVASQRGLLCHVKIRWLEGRCFGMERNDRWGGRQ